MVTCFGHQGVTFLFKTQGEDIEGTESQNDLGLFERGEGQKGEDRIKGDVIPDENKSVIYENKSEQELLA